MSYDSFICKLCSANVSRAFAFLSTGAWRAIRSCATTGEAAVIIKAATAIFFIDFLKFIFSLCLSFTHILKLECCWKIWTDNKTNRYIFSKDAAKITKKVEFCCLLVEFCLIINSFYCTFNFLALSKTTFWNFCIYCINSGFAAVNTLRTN